MSDGEQFVQNGWKRHNNFGVGDDTVGVGDFNGDGRSDVVTYSNDGNANVYVSSSDGSEFVENGWKRHDHFTTENEIPLPRATA